MLVGDLYSLTPAGQRAFPARAGDGVGLRFGAGRALARDLEHVGPAVEHRKQEVALLHVGNADDPRLVADVDNAVV